MDFGVTPKKQEELEARMGPWAFASRICWRSSFIPAVPAASV